MWGGAVASWLVRSSTDRAVRIRALAGDTVLCSWAKHFTLTVPLSTQEYKWVPVICWGNLTNCWGVTCDGLASRPGGVEILLAASYSGNRDKLRPDEPVGSIRLHFHSHYKEKWLRCVVRNVTLSLRLEKHKLRSDCKSPKMTDLKRVKYLHITKNLNLFQVYLIDTGPTQIV